MNKLAAEQVAQEFYKLGQDMALEKVSNAFQIAKSLAKRTHPLNHMAKAKQMTALSEAFGRPITRGHSFKAISSPEARNRIGRLLGDPAEAQVQNAARRSLAREQALIQAQARRVAAAQKVNPNLNIDLIRATHPANMNLKAKLINSRAAMSPVQQRYLSSGHSSINPTRVSNLLEGSDTIGINQLMKSQGLL